jgi:hypothetical protein
MIDGSDIYWGSTVYSWATTAAMAEVLQTLDKLGHFILHGFWHSLNFFKNTRKG